MYLLYICIYLLIHVIIFFYLFNYISIYLHTYFIYSTALITHKAISHSNQCSMTGVTKAMVCAILSVRWCI